MSPLSAPPAVDAVPDVHERLRTLEQAQHQAGVGAWSRDLVTGSTWWSATLAALLGTQGAPSGEHYLEQVHPADRAGLQAAMRRAVLVTGVLDHEHRVLLPDGRLRHLRTTGAVERDPLTGRALTLRGSAQDVTQVHEREAALRTRAAHLDAVAAASRAILTDPQPRAAICRAAQTVTEALSVTLLEVRGDELVGTASSGGGDPRRVRRALTDTSSLLVRVQSSGQPVMVEDTARHAVTDLEGAGSALCVPVFAPLAHDAEQPDEQTVIGVLAAALPDAPPDSALELLAVLQVLAGEAGVAIERADLQRRLAEQARTDGLTGLANRRTWDQELPLVLRRARRAGGQVALAMLDLDHFKAYNDTRGHAAGDQLLRDAAQAWSALLRSTDLLARYGGEEFVLALPGCGEADALALLERVRAGTPGGCTASVGLTVWDGEEDGTDALLRADAALYDAKGAGRDRVRVRLARGPGTPVVPLQAGPVDEPVRPRWRRRARARA